VRHNKTISGFQLLASLALLLDLSALASAQNITASPSSSTASYGSLSEIADKRRALLLVRKAAVVDARGGSGALIEEALNSDPRLSRRYRLAYGTIAQKLNKFIRKYKTLRAVERFDDADYIIFFNLLEYRWPLGSPYPYGELLVILKPELGTRVAPRVVWKSKKVQWAGDAVSDLLNDLKRALGEQQ
jgi:hypothetical protein